METIYQITNIVNGKIYIGQTCDLKRRLFEHKCCKNKKTIISKAVRKYGWENFEIKILEKCKKSIVNVREIYYIKKYKSLSKYGLGYNMTEGGEVSWNKGKDMKELGYDFYETRDARNNIEWTEERRKQHSEACKSEKYYEGLKNRKITGRQYKVKRISDGKIWNSQKECREELKITGYMFRKNIGELYEVILWNYGNNRKKW